MDATLVTILLVSGLFTPWEEQAAVPGKKRHSDRVTFAARSIRSVSCLSLNNQSFRFHRPGFLKAWTCGTWRVGA